MEFFNLYILLDIKKKGMMRTMARLLYLIAAICVAAIVLVNSRFMSGNGKIGVTRGSGTMQEQVQTESERLSEIYLLNFKLEKNVPGTINTYLPDYTEISFETARYYSALFNMTENEEESESYYAFHNEDESLYVDKYVEKLRYESAPMASTDNREPISEEEAIDKALEFISEKLLLLGYDECKVRFDGDFFVITFVGGLANIKNLAFCTNAVLDKDGDIISLDYFNMTYTKLGSCRIKSMSDAFLELPIDFPEDVKIPLTRCELVYIYDNSIVQPAYLFEGIYPGGQSFSANVKAAIFE